MLLEVRFCKQEAPQVKENDSQIRLRKITLAAMYVCVCVS